MEQMEQLYKKFSIITYIEPSFILLSYLNVNEYAYILHDRDFDENGEVKKPHYHLYIKLNGKKRCSTLYNDIIKCLGEGATQPFLIQSCSNERSFQRYLVHADDLDKTQYQISEIKTNLDLKNMLDLEITDLDFIKMVMEKNIKSFRKLVDFSIECGKIELVMAKAYFFKSILKGD